MHNDDIKQLLEHTGADIENILELVKSGKINKVLLKNILENMRSILDYLAQDIVFKLKSDQNNMGLKENVYFPYGQQESHFKNSIQKNLPPLKLCEPKIYELIESIQPFKSKNNWVVDLCKLTNDAKHNNLSKTENKKTNTVEQKGGLRIEACKSISIKNIHTNGVRQDDIIVDNNGEINIVKHSGNTHITSNNRINFQGKGLEIVPFLTHCHKEIKALSTSIGVLLIEKS